MSYLFFTLTNHELHVSERNEEQQVLTEATFPFTTFAFPTTADQMIAKIKDTFLSFSGGVFTPLSADFYETQPELTPLNHSFESFVAYFSEALNIPILTSEELHRSKDIVTALNQKQDYLTWHLDYYGYTPGKEEYSIESLLTIGNGFMGLRGTIPEMALSKDTYPATYLAGLYNEEASEVAGQTVFNEDFVNTPNNQYISLKVEGNEHWLALETAQLHSLHRNLQLRTGLFSSSMVIEDEQQHQFKITAKKIVSMSKMNNYSIAYSFTPLNFSKKVTVKTVTDGSVYNYNVERYRNLSAHHFHITDLSADSNRTAITVQTNQSHIDVQQTATIIGDFFTPEMVVASISDKRIEQTVTVDVVQGETYSLEKHVQVKTSLVQPNWEETLPQPESFEKTFKDSRQAWAALWEKSDIQLSGDLMSQKLLRIHTYHLLVSASPTSNPSLDVSVTARGLHGEAYRGHIFWDEIFILPFYIMHFPETAKQLLMYRYRRLDKAKENAQESNYTGAMYPWQSGLDGSEDTQKLHLNPLNGEWGEDHSILQRHVSLAIAYNIWMYWNNTGDNAFIKAYGAEMLLEIANFWRSAATFDEKTNRYFIDKVMGPDEFHEAYPDSKESGLKNNAYTNLMVVWLFEELEVLLDLLTPEERNDLFIKTGVSAKQIEEMAAIRKGLTIEVNDDGIIAQYEGYFDLKEIDWEQARETYGNIYRMDRILKAEGQSPDDYKVSKQADTLMLFYNLNKERIDEILSDLNYALPADYPEKNLLYYLNRTSHGSTLSRIVHAQLAEEVGFHDLSWTLYQEALSSDYHDIQGGTTAEGIHTGVMAATIYVTLTTYAGIDIKEDLLSIRPNLPKQWSDIRFTMEQKGIVYQLTISTETVRICASQDTQLRVNGALHTVKAKEEHVVTYTNENGAKQ